jgi:c-di-GMP-binding flagellar brake protein YcgR
MAGPYPETERRRHKRVKVGFIVNYSIRKPPQLSMIIGQREVDALMLDLSEGGMAVGTSFDIPQATILAITFTLINHSPLAKEKVRKMAMEGGIVNRTVLDRSEYRLGIQFTKISPEDMTAISDFVKILASSS